jgi:hypothetical protein
LDDSITGYGREETRIAALCDHEDKSNGSVDDHHVDDAPAQSAADAILSTAASFSPATLLQHALPAFRRSVHLAAPAHSRYRPPLRA